MTRSIARTLAAAAAMLAAAVVGGRPEASQTVETLYTVSLLPSLGGTHARGNSINDDGWVAGYSNLPGNQYRHGALWIGGTPTDLGALGSPNQPKNSSVAWPVKNTQGVLVGISQTDSPDPWGENWSCFAFFPPATSTGYRCVGFAWENGVMRPLPTLGGTHGFAAAANNHGQIVGWAENTVRDSSCTPPQVFQFRAVVWGPEGNRVVELPLVPGDSSSAATAINDKGQIVGISGTCDDAVGSATAAHAVLWENGNVEDIGNLGGDEWNTPTAINERGDIIGFSDREGDLVTEAFIWTREDGLKGLGFLDGHGHSEAYGLNDRRQVVGLSCTSTFSECRAFIWENGVMKDLNQLVDPGTGIFLNQGRDINDDGVITGRALDTATGTLEAFVATPAPPGSVPAAASSVAAAADARQEVVRLTPDAAREILWPLGAGRARLDRQPR